MSLPYIQLYVSDYRSSTRRFTTLEHGAYIQLLFEMWENGPWLEYDEVELREIMGLTARQFERVWKRLLKHVLVENGKVTHPRLLADYQKSAQKRVQNSANGSRGGRPKSEKTQQKQGPKKANALRHETKRKAIPEPEPDIKNNISNDILSKNKKSEPSKNPDGEDLKTVDPPPTKPSQPKPKPKQNRKTRIDDDLILQPDWIEKAGKVLGPIPISEIEQIFQHFKEYHQAQGSTMANWSAAWGTWLRNHKKFNGGRNGRASGNQNTYGPRGANEPACIKVAGQRVLDKIYAQQQG